MRTLIIYDTTGRVIFQAGGDVIEPVGIPFLWATPPNGYFIEQVDVSKPEHKPIYKEITKSPFDLLEAKLVESEFETDLRLTLLELGLA